MSATTSVRPDESTRTAAHFGLAVMALAMGGFAIGTAEFVTMGLLPQIADGVGVAIPTAGHVISAYAVGVVVGAPVLAYFGARLPRRGLLLALMGAFVLGNVFSALAGSYGMLMLSRFLDRPAARRVLRRRLPGRREHGVPRASRPGRRDGDARALGRQRGGRARRHLARPEPRLALGVLDGRPARPRSPSLLVRLFVPAYPGDPDATGRRELSAFTSSQVWLTLLAGAIGFGGMFAVYTYIAPTLTEVGGLSEGAVPVFLLAFGLGMVFGTWLAGEMADWSVFGSLFTGALGMAAVLAVFALVAPYGWWSLPLVFAITVAGSVLVVNLQLRLMVVAGDAQTLGAALNHASLNVANALGAWLGGVVIAAGWGYRSPALVGVALSLAGLLVLALSFRVHRRQRVA